MRSGFATVLGRPNVGKSSLVNAMVGTKVSITAARPNTTRHAIRGVLHRDDIQLVFVDTPGLHRPKTRLGHRLNETADSALGGVDLVVVVVEAGAPVGPGDTMALRRAMAALARAKWVRNARGGTDPLTQSDELTVTQQDELASVDLALGFEGRNIDELMSQDTTADTTGEETQTDEGAGPLAMFVVVNKIDAAGPTKTAERLLEVAARCDELRGEYGIDQDDLEYYAVSAVTHRGVDPLVNALLEHLPEGPPYFPTSMVTDTPESVWIAELVREQLVRRMRDELPHAIAVRVVEWEDNHIRCQILVERESQKGMVIGKGGLVLKEVGTEVRKSLPEGTFLELHVSVERDWQGRNDALDTLGY
jgi:GTPase Era involved in 16S rRNA processing